MPAAAPQAAATAIHSGLRRIAPSRNGSGPAPLHAQSLGQAEEPGHRAPDPGRVQSLPGGVISRRPVPPQLAALHPEAQQPVRPRRQRRGHRERGRPRQVRLDQHDGARRRLERPQPVGVERPDRGRVRRPSRPGRRPRRAPGRAEARPRPPPPAARTHHLAATPTPAAPSRLLRRQPKVDRASVPAASTAPAAAPRTSPGVAQPPAPRTRARCRSRPPRLGRLVRPPRRAASYDAPMPTSTACPALVREVELDLLEGLLTRNGACRRTIG